MARRKIKSATDQRKFTLVYNDFLESNILNYYEKMVFITLKKFADNDTMRAFPSLKTIHNITGISLSQVRRSIEHMEELGVLSVMHRIDENKGHQSNLYTLYDYAEIWKVGSSEEIEEVKKKHFVDLTEVSTDVLLEELRRRDKEKEPDKTEPTKVTVEPSTKLNQYDMVNNIAKSNECQVMERYTHEQIRQIFELDYVLLDYPQYKSDVDTVMQILYDVMNTSKPTVRIAGEDKPTMVVIGKMKKLDKDLIVYAIEKYQEHIGDVTNPIIYMRTILYNAPEQFNLEIINRINNQVFTKSR